MEIIKSREDISNLFSCGERRHTPYLTLIIKSHGEHDRGGRVAFVAGKKLGCAVWRNSAKRRMREICRLNGGEWEGYDVVFVAKRRILDVPYDTVQRAYCDLLGGRKTGVR